MLVRNIVLSAKLSILTDDMNFRGDLVSKVIQIWWSKYVHSVRVRSGRREGISSCRLFPFPLTPYQKKKRPKLSILGPIIEFCPCEAPFRHPKKFWWHHSVHSGLQVTPQKESPGTLRTTLPVQFQSAGASPIPPNFFLSCAVKHNIII